MNRQEAFEVDQREWLANEFDELTDEIKVISPSQWAEEKRYLSPAVTPLPGRYSFEVAPYIKEILDSAAIDSPIREIAWMKAAQICATTGVLENIIGYLIDHVKTAPILFVTADAELAQLRMEGYIVPMLQSSDLMDLIKSADDSNKRKSGKTLKKLEWIGGGSLIPFGARNASKMRQASAQVLLNDEVDGWPDTVGDDGDPVKLMRDRTAAYEGSRKIIDLSTPLVKGQSKIEELYERGDQRKYYVQCLRCDHPQVLRWQHTDNETGVVTGMTWETDGDGKLIVDSVRYLCQHCSHPHTDNDKTRLFAENNAEWRPTAPPVADDVRSYHLSALYSPSGMQTWGACVQKWLEAWDPELDRPRDVAKLQVFYNNVLGESFELRGDKILFKNVSPHRRSIYKYGEIPNKFAEQHCGGPVLLLTCAVDVHKHSIKVAVMGWCRDRRPFLVEYHNYEGNPEHVDDHATWGKLSDLIENREYTADDGKRYGVQVTMVDCGYLTDQVYGFCAQYQSGVYPVKGLALSDKSVRVPEFSTYVTPNGINAYGITVDLYKDRWSAALRREWDGNGLQPQGHFNAPRDSTDAQLKELTKEVKNEKIDKRTGKRVGFEWHRPSGAPNELWDLLIYNNAALDLIAWSRSKEKELEFTNWVAFWEECLNQKLFFKG